MMLIVFDNTQFSCDFSSSQVLHPAIGTGFLLNNYSCIASDAVVIATLWPDMSKVDSPVKQTLWSVR